MEPIHYFNFKNIEINIVYFFINETIPISLSHIFENITKLVDFSFNNKYMDNFIINNMSRMFSGCNSLKKI